MQQTYTADVSGEKKEKKNHVLIIYVAFNYLLGEIVFPRCKF